MFASKDIFLTPPSGGYSIARSVRTRSSASGYFSRTPASATNRQIWTWSGWVKRGTLGAYQPLFVAGVTGGQQVGSLAFSSAGGIYDKLELNSGVQAVSVEFWIQTNAVYRDPSAWYHVVASVDTTQATASNRVKLYINGSQITATSAYASYSQYPSQNYNTPVNNTVQHLIARDIINTAGYFDGYMTEINFIDGQALTPSSFGTTNAITGVWQPAKYTGTYGTNGFYLNFSDNSSNTATTIGKDYSGNANNWTPNNISVTAGTTYDSMVDSPTVGATSSNYAVINPNNASSSSVSITNGNLDLSIAAAATCAVSTMAVTSGKWYWEFTAGTASQNAYYVSVCDVNNWSAPSKSQNDMYNSTYVWTYYGNTGNKITNATLTAYGSSFTSGDVIGVALDMDAGTLVFYKNNTSQGTAFSVFSGKTIAPMIGNGASTSSIAGSINFGQRPFSYTPPTGYVALNTYNLPASTITNGAAYMAATTYSGNSSTQTISNAVNGVSFQPDFVWMKVRSAAYDHTLQDSIRGTTKYLNSNNTAAEDTATTLLTSFNSSGFSLGNSGNVNASGQTYIGWQWKAGTTSASNTNGSITSTVSAGATQGFSVVTYTGTGANATVGHGLGVAPSMVITKKRNSTSAWVIGLTYSGFTWSTDYFQFDTGAKRTNGAGTVFTAAPTSTVFSLGTDAGENGNGDTFVAYCFAAVAGYSAFGSYTGNGSADGPFTYLGFRPRFVMVKRTDTTGDWWIWDSARNTFNVMTYYLAPNRSDAEFTANTIDFLSNGFKFRDSSSGWNASGGTYIYMAFAENPFRNALAR